VSRAALVARITFPAVVGEAVAALAEAVAPASDTVGAVVAVAVVAVAVAVAAVPSLLQTYQSRGPRLVGDPSDSDSRYLEVYRGSPYDRSRTHRPNTVASARMLLTIRSPL